MRTNWKFKAQVIATLWTSTRVMVPAAAICFMILMGGGGTSVLAQEAIYQEEPTATSVEESVSPIERSYITKEPRPGIFPSIKEQLKDTDPFFRDTNLDLNLRTYYFYRDKYDGSVSEAWALGGGLVYKSGYFLDHFAVGAAGYASLPLYAPEDRDGTLLLQPGQDGYAVLGQLYGEIKVAPDNFFRFYRQEYNTPFINKNDSRMTPNTFEGYSFQGSYGGKEKGPGFRYGAGYIAKIKERNSDEFVYMSVDAGAPVEKGVWLGGVLFSQGGFSIGAIDYYCEDVINIAYAEAKYTWPVNEKFGVRFAAQFTDQRSLGEDLLKGTSFSVNQVGLKTEMSYGGVLLTFGLTIASTGADLQSPWSGYPGYTSVQVKDFNRANEKAFLVKAAYDFTHIGMEDVTAYALFAHGWNRIDPSTGQDVPNENELDFDLQWKPKKGFFKNFWPRFRYAVVYEREGQERNIHDFRVILNYDLSLL